MLIFYDKAKSQILLPWIMHKEYERKNDVRGVAAGQTEKYKRRDQRGEDT